MKHGLSLISWTNRFNNANIGLIEKAKMWGYDGVEIPIRNPEDVDVGALAHELRTYSMGCTILPQFGVKEDLINPDTNAYALNRFKELIQFAGRLNATALGGAWYTSVGVGKNKKPRSESEWKLAVASLRELSKVAEKENIILSLEPITRFETSFLNTSAETVKLLEEVGSEWLGVNLDIYHMYMEEADLLNTIIKTGHHLKHLHVNENHRGIPGTGMTRWEEVIKTLKSIDYHGWLVLEILSPKVDYMIAGGCIWRDPLNGKSRGDAARESVEYLKRIIDTVQVG